MSPSDDGGYVHTPSGFDAETDGTEKSGEPGNSDPGSESPHPETADREFDWRGWLLVAVIVFAFLVVPAAIFFVPPGAEGYRFALLILPLAPAAVLAITAVWATTRP
ncbi:hypothetical protein [Natrinema halophilum]|uniref:Uncharacterized protein n=1 Tax=Natrinema halophilum TaxID=1699371 RepID=A0A7D5KSZ6_9EURY|nr:hypothetical protein [Natrinema halophilum]QLG50917.1 hypothetical protein HYG82_19800 [Natrinema halophilum]